MAHVQPRAAHARAGPRRYAVPHLPRHIALLAAPSALRLGRRAVCTCDVLARDSGRLLDVPRQDLLGPAADRVHLVRHRAGQTWAEAEAEAKGWPEAETKA